MVKHSQTKGGKLQYLSPQTDVVIIQAGESLLSSSMSIPDIGEIDLGWGTPTLDSPSGLDMSDINSLGGLNGMMF